MDEGRTAYVAEQAAVAMGLSQRNSLITALTCTATLKTNAQAKRNSDEKTFQKGCAVSYLLIHSLWRRPEDDRNFPSTCSE